MTETRINRPGFLKISCAGAAALGLTVCGATAMVPGPAPFTPGSYSYEGDNMQRRILVAYASCAGSTAEIAQAIGATIGNNGFSVDSKPLTVGPQIDGYQALLIGGPADYYRRDLSE